MVLHTNNVSTRVVANLNRNGLTLLIMVISSQSRMAKSLDSITACPLRSSTMIASFSCLPLVVRVDGLFTTSRSALSPSSTVDTGLPFVPPTTLLPPILLVKLSFLDSSLSLGEPTLCSDGGGFLVLYEGFDGRLAASGTGSMRPLSNGIGGMPSELLRPELLLTSGYDRPCPFCPAPPPDAPVAAPLLMLSCTLLSAAPNHPPFFGCSSLNAGAGP